MEDYSHINETLFASQEHSPLLPPPPPPFPHFVPRHTHSFLRHRWTGAAPELVNNNDFWFPAPDLGDPELVRHELFQQMHQGILTQVVMVHTFGNITLNFFFFWGLLSTQGFSSWGSWRPRDYSEHLSMVFFSVFFLTGLSFLRSMWPHEGWMWFENQRNSIFVNIPLM